MGELVEHLRLLTAARAGGIARLLLPLLSVSAMTEIVGYEMYLERYVLSAVSSPLDRFKRPTLYPSLADLYVLATT